ncbi:Gp37-like protein [Streptosporangium sp. G12]
MRNFQIFVRESLFPRSKAEGGDGLAPLAIVGGLDTYTAFDAIQRHNAIGSWKLTVPAGSPQSKMLIPGRGIVVIQEGETDPIFSGPIRQLRKRWDPEAAGAGTVDVSGVDDNYLLAERLAWTNPAADIHLASAVQYWQANPTWPNVAEVLRQLFLANTQGNAARKLDRLFIPHVDTTTDFLDDDVSRVTRLRYDQVDQLVSLLTAVYGFRIHFSWHADPASVASNGDPAATGPGILLKLEPIADLSGEIQFGAEMGNLRGYDYMVQAPEATRIVVATQNRTWREFERVPTYSPTGTVSGYTENWAEKSGPERWYGYFKNDEYDPEWWGVPADTPADKQHTLAWATAGFTATETEWGVTAERYKDRRDITWQWLPDPAKQAGWALDPPVWSAQYRAIQDEVDAFNLDSGPAASISIDPIETDTTMYGRDYGLGDVVRVHIDGEVRDEIVREARLTSSAEDGPRVKPTIGTYGTGETPFLYASIRNLWGRVNGVEARENLVQLEEVPVSDFLIKKAA